MTDVTTGIANFNSPSLRTTFTIDQAITAGLQLFQNPLTTPNGAIQTQATALMQQAQALASGANPTDSAMLTQLMSAMGSLSGGAGALQQHAQQMISGGGVGALSGGLMSTLTSALSGIQTNNSRFGFQTGQQQSGCGNLSNLMGTVMGIGASLMGGAQSLLGSAAGFLGMITGLISGGLSNALLQQGMALVAGLLGSAAGMVSRVASEIAGFAAMAAQMAQMAISGLLSGVLGDPCAAQVLSAVGTSGLLSLLQQQFNQQNPAPTAPTTLPTSDRLGRTINWVRDPSVTPGAGVWVPAPNGDQPGSTWNNTTQVGGFSDPHTTGQVQVVGWRPVEPLPLAREAFVPEGDTQVHPAWQPEHLGPIFGTGSITRFTLPKPTDVWPAPSLEVVPPEVNTKPASEGVPSQTPEQQGNMRTRPGPLNPYE